MRKLAVVFGVVIGLILGATSIAEANVWRSPISSDGTMVQRLKAAFGLTIGGGAAITGSFVGSHTIDLGPIGANSCASDQTVTVTGAAAGAPCVVGTPADGADRVQAVCFASAADTVKIRICNGTATASVDPPSVTYTVRVFNP